MADGNEVVSFVRTNFTLENIDVNSIKLLNKQSRLIYDNCRIKWTWNLVALKEFIDKVVSLSGIWKSPGGTAKQFQCSGYDLTLTWYPGKQNTLIFHGKDGEILRKFLINLLEKPRDEQATIIQPVSCGSITDTDLSMRQETIKNTNAAADDKLYCTNCGDMAIKLSEIEKKLCGLYDITYKIYNSVSGSTTISDSFDQTLFKAVCSNVDKVNHKSEGSLSEYYELSTDLEEIKLDAVINHTKLSNNISSNSKVISASTQEINQLKEQLTIMQNECHVFNKQISKQSETIKQLSSKVHDLQNTELIHSTQQSVSTMSKELLNTQQTAECFDLHKQPSPKDEQNNDCEKLHVPPHLQ